MRLNIDINKCRDFGTGKTESFYEIYITVNNAWIIVYIDSKIHYEWTKAVNKTVKYCPSHQNLHWIPTHFELFMYWGI